MEGRKLNKHRPFHIYDGHTYFVTGRCYNGIDYFKENSKKEMFRKILKDSIEKFNIKLFSWVLLNNHYHVMFTVQALDEFHSVQFVTPKVNEWNDEMSESEFRYTLQKKKIVEFVRKLHKDTARILNKQNNTQGRKIWYQYFDYCIRNKTDFWKHFNYIIKNPFKHGLVFNLEEAFYYKYSSNPVWLKRFGMDGLNESFTKYLVEEVFVDE
ncbi:MAG: hypothetical protein COX80_00615 [Candidatus Magasanikbacteria bacterium CG_4_10_14_0_2_um_filter_33_14]|uniref:Transposase IS200-like domain-containing protein n=1 Tax=Candidatus Magasanikbacteria bacterium CG_4_10_14_0_2_um_filter_33_14 TaxID=1974636 RepID=A0A2M7VBU1_9BACT|nr:MAG: hypothetical protein COX80_00615 [Candidatus Magasanikbacteria bacterium CG_4_10_14_0_2_um_filter_33_14]